MADNNPQTTPATQQESQVASPLFDMSKSQPIQSAQPATQDKPLFDMSKSQPIQGAATSQSQATQAPSIGPKPNTDLVDPNLFAPNDPVENLKYRLTIPLVKKITDVHDKLREVENFTQEGREEHPIQAKFGDIANKLEGLLFGNEQHPEAGIGTGKSGILTNPITSALIPGAEGEPALAGAIRGGANLVKSGVAAGRELLAGRSAASEAEGAWPRYELSDGKRIEVHPDHESELLKRDPGAQKTPVEAAVEKGVQKSGLTTGAPATTAPTAEGIQPAIQSGVRNVFSGVAKDSGVQTSSAKSIRAIAEETGDSVLAKSKGLYKQIDDATGGRFQGNADAIKAVNDDLKTVSNDTEETNLLGRKQRLMWEQEKMFDEAATKGVSTETVTQAKASYQKAQALYDTDAAIKSSTAGRAGVGKGVETLDPNKLVPRLHKLYDSGRLQQAIGEDGANSLIEHAENAQTALKEIKDFVPSTPTGKNALQDIITRNTTEKSSIAHLGKTVGKTDWNGAVKDFGNLSTEQQTQMFGADVPRIRQFLGKQALRQNAVTALKIAGATLTGGGLTRLGYDAATK